MQYRKRQFKILLSILVIGAMISTAQAKEPFRIESELISANNSANNYRPDSMDGNLEWLKDNHTWEFSGSYKGSNKDGELDPAQGIAATFTGLNSAYEIPWHRIWFAERLHATSTELEAFTRKIEALLNVDNSGADLVAEADWNLVADFEPTQNFKAGDGGNALDLTNGLNILFTSNLALNLDYSYQDWYTAEGHNTVNFEKGSQVRTQLNDVNWESYAFGIGIVFNF